MLTGDHTGEQGPAKLTGSPHAETDERYSRALRTCALDGSVGMGHISADETDPDSDSGVKWMLNQCPSKGTPKPEESEA